MDGAFWFALAGRYGLAAVFAAVALEYACFPVPSEIILPFSGAFAAAWGVAFWQVFSLSVAAGLTGSFACYAAGRWGGTAILGRIRLRAPRTGPALDACGEWFQKHGSVSVMLGRVLPLFRTWISFFAGISRQNPLQFAGFSAAGIAAWNLVLVGLGFWLGSSWESAALWARRFQTVIFPVVVLLCFLLARRLVYGFKRGK